MLTINSENRVIPILFGSSFKYRGVYLLFNDVGAIVTRCNCKISSVSFG